MVSKGWVRGGLLRHGDMVDGSWAERLAQPSDFNRLNCIHIAGTKGKGSTSAFISSILAQYLPGAAEGTSLIHKIGLYTSPHLRFVRERIQINNKPLSEESFAKYFFEVWDRLEDAAIREGHPTDTSAKPVYFRFLTLMAFHTYMCEGVDTAVIECGIGGEYDTTNIIEGPTVTGITSLGIDHTAMLGNTIEEIAWHKAGIMKTGSPSFTAPQPQNALKVLQKRAEERSVALKVVDPHPQIDKVALGLAADFQKTNASLAIAIASAHLRSLGHPSTNTSPLPLPFLRGLAEVCWPGRCETRHEGNIAWHIDAGHTLESIEAAGRWLASLITPVPANGLHSSRRRTRILLFNQQTRNAASLARKLHSTLSAALHNQQPFTHAVFSTNLTFAKEGYGPDLVSVNANAMEIAGLEVQNRLAETWLGLDPATEVVVRGSIEEAVNWVRDVAQRVKDEGQEEEVKVLVTGSVHLVGGFLEIVETAGRR